MRPGLAEAESGGRFLGGKFSRCFNNCAEWIDYQAGILTIGVVDTPQLVARTWSHGRAHGGSGAHTVQTVVYHLHKNHAQSVWRPMSSHGKVEMNAISMSWCLSLLIGCL